MEAEARAKVNLTLRVGPRLGELHTIRSVAYSVDWHDRVEMRLSESDVLDAVGAPVPLDDANLVWKAIKRIRREGPSTPVAIRLVKRIPTAAGLAGGSADAAAALVLYARLAGFPSERLAALAPEVGSDVPFCLHGGPSLIEGTGERLRPLDLPIDDHCLAIVVPPFELETAAVYAAWDAMGGQAGQAVKGRSVPPSLRSLELVNDLYRAAVRCRPELDDWRLELEARWDRPVLLSGSGPALFGFFPDPDEAEDALGSAPEPTRGGRLARPVAGGVAVR